MNVVTAGICCLLLLSSANGEAESLSTAVEAVATNPRKAGRSHNRDLAASQQPSQTGITIRSGVVVIDGREYHPPFSFEHQAGHIFLNGNLVQSVPDTTLESRRHAAETLIANAERSLLRRHHVLVFGRQVMLQLDPPRSREFLRTLREAETSDERVVVAVMRDLPGTKHLSTSVWREALVEFDAGTLLKGLERTARTVSEMEAELATSEVIAVSSSPWGHSEYLLNIAGMVLIVIAASVLIRQQPHLSGAWRERSSGNSGTRQIWRTLSVLVALGIFDLVCTLASLAAASAFVELNPIANHLADSPLALCVYKLCATGIGVCLLWKLRIYNGAQIASWWLCLICTIVTVRWVAVQSLLSG